MTRVWPRSPAGGSGPTTSIAGCRSGSPGSRCESTVQRLADAGIPAAPVVSPSLVTENPQLRDRGFFETLEHPSIGAGLYPCPPFAPLAGPATGG